MIGFLILVMVGTALWTWWKMRRQRMLSGLLANKPTFHIEPPMRRQEKSSRGVL